MGGQVWSSRTQHRQRASVCKAACRSFPPAIRLSLPNTLNGADEDFRWSVGALGSAHAAENRGRQHRSSPRKAGNTGLADLASDERLTLMKKDSHTGRVARQDVERQTKGESPPIQLYIGCSPPLYSRQLRSVLSFAFPSAIVCHCILNGASAPPHSSGLM